MTIQPGEHLRTVNGLRVIVETATAKVITGRFDPPRHTALYTWQVHGVLGHYIRRRRTGLDLVIPNSG